MLFCFYPFSRWFHFLSSVGSNHPIRRSCDVAMWLPWPNLAHVQKQPTMTNSSIMNPGQLVVSILISRWFAEHILNALHWKIQQNDWIYREYIHIYIIQYIYIYNYMCVSFCVPLNKSKEILFQDLSFRRGPHPNGHWHYGCSGRLSSRGRLQMSSSSTLQLVRLGGKILGFLWWFSEI